MIKKKNEAKKSKKMTIQLNRKNQKRIKNQISKRKL